MQPKNQQQNSKTSNLISMLSVDEFAQLQQLIKHDPQTAARIVEMLEQKMAALSNNDSVGAKHSEDVLMGYFDAQYANLVRDRIIHTTSEAA